MINWESPPMGKQDQQLIVVANREPYCHERDGQGHVIVRRSGSGVVNAVEPLLKACSGVWVGHGSAAGDRDSATDRDGVNVPPDRPSYRLRRVWLSEEEERQYYDGFANSGLWPLCHRTYVQPVFRSEDFNTYRTVNERFANAVCEEGGSGSPVVLVQDYHFALAPLMIRRQRPSATVAAFWHIPWPHWQTFAACPWRTEILQGLLGSNVLGFQTPADCFNFVETVDRLLGAQIDCGEGMVTYKDRQVLVRDYPASIEWPGNWTNAGSIAACRAAVRRELRVEQEMLVAVGVDRMDFTKGIEEKFLMVERLLESRPDLRGRLVFVELAEPSRGRLAAYRKARLAVLDTAERINRRFSNGMYQPIVIHEAHHSQTTIARYFRAADVCVVSSLHDGMNLVCKEFVASRDDEQGVLLLSEFAGAANELHDAVIINPYDTDRGAAAMASALEMPREQQRDRMRRLRAVVAVNDAHAWAARMLGDVLETCRRAPRDAQAAAKSRLSVMRVPSWSNAETSIAMRR
jgi:trehalose-6-phosphate synthase